MQRAECLARYSIRIESITQNYPTARDDCRAPMKSPRKLWGCRNSRHILLRSTLGLVGGVASFVLTVLLLVFVLTNPRPLVVAAPALAPDRYRAQAHRTRATYAK